MTDGGNCSSGKKHYPSRKNAKTWAKKYQGRKLRPYLCKECGDWHLTRQTQGCDPRRKKYPTQEAAEEIGAIYNTRKAGFCKACGNWHLYLPNDPYFEELDVSREED